MIKSSEVGLRPAIEGSPYLHYCLKVFRYLRVRWLRNLLSFMRFPCGKQIYRSKSSVSRQPNVNYVISKMKLRNLRRVKLIVLVFGRLGYYFLTNLYILVKFTYCCYKFTKMIEYFWTIMYMTRRIDKALWRARRKELFARRRERGDRGGGGRRRSWKLNARGTVATPSLYRRGMVMVPGPRNPWVMDHELWNTPEYPVMR